MDPPKNHHSFTAMEALPLLLGVLIILVLGFNFYTNDQLKKNQDPNNSISSVEPIDDQVLPLGEITQLVAKEESNSAATRIELEKEDGLLLYKVRLKNGALLTYNARSGQLLVIGRQDQKDDVELPAVIDEGIGFDGARKVALAKYPDSVIKRIELTYEGDVLVYSVRFSDNSRILVNAANGGLERFNQKSKGSVDNTKQKVDKPKNKQQKKSKKKEDNVQTIKSQIEKLDKEEL